MRVLRPAVVHLERPADELVAALPDGCRATPSKSSQRRRPAEDRLVERAGGREVARHQLAPDRRAGLAVHLVAVMVARLPDRDLGARGVAQDGHAPGRGARPSHPSRRRRRWRPRRRTSPPRPRSRRRSTRSSRRCRPTRARGRPPAARRTAASCSCPRSRSARSRSSRRARSRSPSPRPRPCWARSIQQMVPGACASIVGIANSFVQFVTS